ncbi:hypothetical protein JCM24511_09797 [Saitozyma sp. JCM 24511]|nr:hypothetical protein JCM24511_09797 [Saitozyma sp. JCM 24511]
MSSNAPSTDASKAGSSDTSKMTENTDITAPSGSQTFPTTTSTQSQRGDSAFLSEEWYFQRTGQKMSEFRLLTATPGCARSTESSGKSK